MTAPSARDCNADLSGAPTDFGNLPVIGRERMLAFTRRSIGKVMVTSWDRKQETRAVISGVFGQYFQTTGLDVQTVKLWVLLLGHGRLPVTVRSVEIRHPTAP